MSGDVTQHPEPVARITGREYQRSRRRDCAGPLSYDEGRGTVLRPVIVDF